MMEHLCKLRSWFFRFIGNTLEAFAQAFGVDLVLIGLVFLTGCLVYVVPPPWAIAVIVGLILLAVLGVYSFLWRNLRDTRDQALRLPPRRTART